MIRFLTFVSHAILSSETEIKSIIKLNLSIFGTFNYLNNVREQVTDNAGHALKVTYSIFFLENLNHAIERIFTCAFSMLMLFFVKENLFFIRGDLPNIYKEDLQARTTKDTWTRASSAIESGQAHQILLTNQLTN